MVSHSPSAFNHTEREKTKLAPRKGAHLVIVWRPPKTIRRTENVTNKQVLERDYSNGNPAFDVHRQQRLEHHQTRWLSQSSPCSTTAINSRFSTVGDWSHDFQAQCVAQSGVGRLWAVIPVDYRKEVGYVGLVSRAEAPSQR